MSIIKQTAHDNLAAVDKPLNILLGGNYKFSPYYHSFGPFIHQDFQRFDPVEELDFPINMKYKDIESVS